MRLLESSAPRQPRRAEVAVSVVVRFVVDTAGRVERGSVAVAASSHPLFTAAEAGGRRVRQLGEMPFEFVLGGR